MTDPVMSSGMEFIFAALAFALIATALSGFLWYRLKRRNARLTTALMNMTQGLCLWDAQTRLVVCNDRYIRMYGMSPDVVRPGTTLEQIVRHRMAIGNFNGDPESYVSGIRARIAEGKSTTHILHLDGRTISVAEQPLPGGGWLATHEDVTRHYHLEQERAAISASDQRRATVDSAIGAFNTRVEHLLRSVKDSAVSLKETASALFSASDETSARAQSALQASSEASGSTAGAASATDEMASSIGEIGRQLTQTTDVVRQAVDEASATNDGIKTLAEAAQKIGAVVELIRNIAGQTNLLALNATIEAARAGRSGRGFAVVASEVKSLAVQTAKATEEDFRADFRDAEIDRQRGRRDRPHHRAHAGHPQLCVGGGRRGRAAECGDAGHFAERQQRRARHRRGGRRARSGDRRDGRNPPLGGDGARCRRIGRERGR
ncbi:MAG: PAS-domain containing protein [Xanthobacteraceae bacterium]|nr:PAS-domain containing protein [Xanthobacteraceae bacterium]